jgi:hypothetical protein
MAEQPTDNTDNTDANSPGSAPDSTPNPRPLNHEGKPPRFGKHVNRPGLPPLGGHAKGNLYDRYRWTPGEKQLAWQQLGIDPDLIGANRESVETIPHPSVESVPNSFGKMGIYDTGFTKLDNLMLGFDPGEYSVLGAGTNQGKTQLALYIATHLAMRDIPVLYISRELDDYEVKARAEYIRQFQGGTPDLSSLRYVDTRRMTPDKLMYAIIDFKAAHCPLDLGFVIVDHLHAFCRGANLTERLGELSERLRDTATQTRLPILALSQLNRQPYNELDGPDNYHLKESGYIEEDAYTVMLAWRNTDGFHIKLTKSRRRDLANIAYHHITLRAKDGKLSE